jgi:DNA-binding MarR family transcriptional regulator
MASEADAWRHSNIGRLLNNAVQRFEGRVLELLADAGQAPIRLSHINMTRNLDIAGTRITELARRAAMTKQAMSELVAQCETTGLVTRLADPTDARAKIIIFTEAGLEWLAAFRKAVNAAEDEMSQELGVLRVDGLAAALKAYTKDADPLV